MEYRDIENCYKLNKIFKNCNDAHKFAIDQGNRFSYYYNISKFHFNNELYVIVNYGNYHKIEMIELH